MVQLLQVLYLKLLINDEKKVIRENVKLVRMVKLSLLAYAGDYKFIEVTAPKYYDKNTNPIEFTIKESQGTSPITVTAKNSNKGGIELTKVNAADEKKHLKVQYLKSLIEIRMKMLVRTLLRIVKES